MAKKVVATLRDKTAAKNFAKVIKGIKSPITGAYSFKEGIVHKDKVKDYLSSK